MPPKHPPRPPMQPSDFQKTIINDAIALRGSVITSYSQVEFLLADISVKLNLRFPYLIKDRIKAVKQIAQRAGYEKYRDELEKVCNELIEYDEIRTFMAHGFLTVTTDANGGHKLEYRMYQRDGEGKFNLLLIETTIPLLEQAAITITKYVSDAVQLFGRIYNEQQLEG